VSGKKADVLEDFAGLESGRTTVAHIDEQIEYPEHVLGKSVRQRLRACAKFMDQGCYARGKEGAMPARRRSLDVGQRL
jgi:hypothetical protein